MSLANFTKGELMANTKLLKVMDYLINEQEDKARELLHQIFIEKARAIHEEMMHDMDEEVTLGGNECDDLTHDIKADLEEIDAEHTMNMEGDQDDQEEELDVEDAEEDLSDEMTHDEDDVEVEDDEEFQDVDTAEDADDTDMDMVDQEDEGEMERIHDLEQAIAELKAEFEALKGEEHSEEEDKMAEAWASETNDLAEDDYDDLDENVDLETVHAAKGGEVGSGKFAPADTNKHSPVPASQTDQMGARPVKTGQGAKASGYDRQSAPESKSMNLSNRRKDADDGKHPVSKEGDSAALLNKGTSAGFGAVGTKSPISGRK